MGKYDGLCIFLRHRDGANHAFRGRRLAKLLRDLEKGLGQETLADLVMAGYECTMGDIPVSEFTFERIYNEARGRFPEGE